MEPKFLIELIVSPFILPCMSRMDRWFAERPSPAEIACALAGDKFWRDARLRLIGTHPDWPDAAWLLRLDEAVAHAFVLVLSRLPAARRRDFAEAFYARRDGSGAELSRDSRERLALAVAETLDPAGDVVDAKEVFARVAWAAVETQATRDVLELVLELDRLCG